MLFKDWGVKIPNIWNRSQLPKYEKTIIDESGNIVNRITSVDGSMGKVEMKWDRAVAEVGASGAAYGNESYAVGVSQEECNGIVFGYDCNNKAKGKDMIGINGNGIEHKDDRKFILVTGGGGFIGSEVVRHLHCLGYNVFVVDPAPAPKVLAGLEEGPHYRYFECTLQEFMEKYENDCNDGRMIEHDLNGPCEIMAVVHLAGIVGVTNVMRDPHRVFNENVEMVGLLSKHMYNTPICFASTSEVYESSINSHKETDLVQMPKLKNDRGLYSVSKWLGERELFVDCPCTNNVVMRLFNIVGRLQDPMKGVVPKMVVDALTRDEITIYDTGAHRSFTHVDTVLEFVATWLKCTFRSPSGKYVMEKVYNIVSQAETTSMLQLARKVKHYVDATKGNKDSVRLVIDAPDGLDDGSTRAITDRFGDSSKLETLLGSNIVYGRFLDQVIKDIIQDNL